MRSLIGIFIATLLICGCAERESARQRPVRQRFVPTDAQTSQGQGASWSALAPAPNRPGAFWLHAHAGIGDEFPVHEQNGPTLFDVVVREGNDDHLTLEIRREEDVRAIRLNRDEPLSLRIAANQYEFYYPSVHVDPGSRTTTSQVFLIVTRLP
jgi:hypothetical protein